MTDLSRIDHELDEDKLTCRVVIETPKGSRGKLVYEPETEAFALKRLLPDGMSFPLDFGFAPSTRGEDGDPLDVLVVHDEPLGTGTLVRTRLIGVLVAEQSKEGRTIRNDRIVAVANASHLFAHMTKLEDLGQPFLKNLERFWVNYNALRGVDFRVLDKRDGQTAAQLIRSSSERL